MLYAETDEDGDQVFLHADLEGVQQLKKLLEMFEAEPEKVEHDHLMTQAWGGYGLDENLSVGSRDSGSEKNRAVHHMKLYFWPRGWK